MTLEEYLAQKPTPQHERQYQRVVELMTIMYQAGFAFGQCNYAPDESGSALVIELVDDEAALVVY